MILAVYLPLLVCLALAALAGPAARRLPPGIGVWSLAIAAVTAAAGSLWSLVLLVGVLLDDLPGFDRLATSMPVPDPVSVAAAVVLTICAVRGVRAARRLSRDVDALRRMTGGGEELVVADRADAEAFAVGARWFASGGTVYVTSGMVRLLDPAQLRVLMTHERAHLDARHGTARFLGSVCAAAVPILIPVRDAIAFLCERHADEVAATVTGSRALVAKTVALAALARSGLATSPPTAPALHRLAVTDRVTALLAVPPKRQWWQLALWATAIAVSVGGVLDATTDFASFVRAL